MDAQKSPAEKHWLSRFRFWRWPLLVVAIGSAGAAIGYWEWRESPTAPSKSFSHDDDDRGPPTPQNPGYVDVEACASCHAQRVAAFKSTSHFHACREPKDGDMPPGFMPGQGEYQARDPHLKFESGYANGRFTQTAIRSNASPPHRSTAKIDLMYGTGNGDQIYFTWKEDRLFELPVAWLFPFKRWGEQPFDPYGPSNFARTTTPRCLECHNTWIGHIPGSENQYDRSNMILGVTCEKCHGPGHRHVEFHQRHPDATSGNFIVKPRQLPRDRQMDLCGQCHSSAPQRRGPAFSYRPGEPLEQYFRPARNKYQENDHVADQVRYLREGKCFQHSESMNCVTCHDPHRSQTSAEKTQAAQQACLHCHQGNDCHERDRLPAAVREDCINCHMPRFTRIQVFFHFNGDRYVPVIRPRQHRIAIEPTATQEVLLNWRRTQTDNESRSEAARLETSLVGHWLEEAERFQKQHRFMAAIGAYREAIRIAPSNAIQAKLDRVIEIQAKIDRDWFKALNQIGRREFVEAIDTLNAILRLKPDLAKAHAKLGTLYANANRFDLAVTHLQEAVKDDPDDPQGEMMLAWLAFLNGDFEKSAERYQRADQIRPYDAKIHYLWGTALAKLQRWPAALEQFRRVVEIDPRHDGGCLSLAICLNQQQRSKEALAFAQRAVRLTRFENASALEALAETYVALNRFEEADDIVTKGLALPESKLSPDSRQRLREIRIRANKRAHLP